MPLDLVIQDDAGHPKLTVSISWDMHDDIIKYAAAFGSYPLILRMADYFQDACYDPKEVEPLLNELGRLEGEIDSKTAPPARTGVQTTLERMQDLCREALREDRGVRALSD